MLYIQNIVLCVVIKRLSNFILDWTIKNLGRNENGLYFEKLVKRLCFNVKYEI